MCVCCVWDLIIWNKKCAVELINYEKVHLGDKLLCLELNNGVFEGCIYVCVFAFMCMKVCIACICVVHVCVPLCVMYMCMHVYMCACVFVLHVCVCICYMFRHDCTYVQVDMHGCSCVYSYTCIFVHVMSTHLHMYVCQNVYVYACVFECCVYACACVFECCMCVCVWVLYVYACVWWYYVIMWMCVHVWMYALHVGVLVHVYVCVWYVSVHACMCTLDLWILSGRGMFLETVHGILRCPLRERDIVKVRAIR